MFRSLLAGISMVLWTTACGSSTEALVINAPSALERGVGTRVRVVATAGDGKVGQGTVTLTSDTGSLSDGQTLELDGFGVATFDYVCDVALDPDCAADRITLSATWNKTPAVQATNATIRLTTPNNNNNNNNNNNQTGTLGRLTYRVIDAEISQALDLLITVSETPNALNIIDLKGGGPQSVMLTYVPTSVSVSPDGRTAAVGHDGHVSIVDLTTRTVSKTLDATCDVLDVVLAGNGYVYAFPRRDQWEAIRSINIASGAETLSGASSIYAGTRARLHPSGAMMYGADNGLSPSDIERYDISGGTATYAWDSPYHGDYPMCGDLWFTEDGDRIFTRCGRVFRHATAQSTDMTYAGALSGVNAMQSVAHSAALNRVLVVPQDDSFSPAVPPLDSTVRRYSGDALQFESELTAPLFPSGTTPAYYQGTTTRMRAHGRYVFARSGTQGFVVLLQADASLTLAQDWAVWLVP